MIGVISEQWKFFLESVGSPSIHSMRALCFWKGLLFVEYIYMYIIWDNVYRFIFFGEPASEKNATPVIS